MSEDGSGEPLRWPAPKEKALLIPESGVRFCRIHLRAESPAERCLLHHRKECDCYKLSD